MTQLAQISQILFPIGTILVALGFAAFVGHAVMLANGRRTIPVLVPGQAQQPAWAGVVTGSFAQSRAASVAAIGSPDLAGSPTPLDRVEGQAGQDEGIFAEPLRRILLLLRRDPALCEGVREALRGRPCPSLDAFYRLRSAGVLAGESVEGARLRCRLFEQFLGRHLA